MNSVVTAEKRIAGVHPGITALLILAFVIAVGGLMTISQATQGVGTLALRASSRFLGGFSKRAHITAL